MLALLSHFSALEDPRVPRTRLHSLPSILGIALCAVICGAEGWVEMESYGNAKREWLEQWLDLPNGIPSHDTFARVFAHLDPRTLGTCLQAVTQLLVDGLEKQIAIDGKYLRGSFDTATERRPLVMLNAWASSQRLVLASVPVDLKSNEIKAVPELLAMIEISGCVVTLDAMGCQTAIASQIIAQGGDYVLALKGNQESIHTDAALFFDHALQTQWEEIPHLEHNEDTLERGRRVKKRCHVVDLADLKGLWDDVPKKWIGLRSLVRLESERTQGEKTTKEVRYYLSSLSGDSPKVLRAIRRHWGVENSLHWVLDVAFDEDDCRIRKDHAPANLSLIRHIALNLLRREKTCKNGIKVKRTKAGWDDKYLRKVIESCSQI